MCDYETMDEMDSMQYHIDELEEKLDKIKEVFEKFDHEQRNNPKYHHSNLLLLTLPERDKLYLNLFSSMLRNIISIIGYKPNRK